MSTQPKAQLEVRRLLRDIRDGDERDLQAALRSHETRRNLFLVLTLTVGALIMLLQGLKLLFVNWRLSLLQIIPAMWIWAAMVYFKVHVFHGREFRLWYGPGALLVILGTMLITVASLYLNAVFGFAISAPGHPEIRPAFRLASRYLPATAGIGAVLGLALGVSAVIVPRWGYFWFALALGVVIGLEMVIYVALPSRLIGITPGGTRRDKLAASVVGGAIGACICTPPYAVGRVGIILLGSGTWFPLGVIMVAVGFVLQAGATGAVKAVKMSAKFLVGQSPDELPTAGATPVPATPDTGRPLQP
jgi:hypothetical protein